MTVEEFKSTLGEPEPPVELPAPLAALWWDAKGDWARAHGMVDDLSTRDAMAVHAYLSGTPTTGIAARAVNSIGLRSRRSGWRLWRGCSKGKCCALFVPLQPVQVFRQRV